MQVYLNDMGIISALGAGKEATLKGVLGGDISGIMAHSELATLTANCLSAQ